MPKSLSNAEKQRLYRQRRDANPQRRENYLNSKKEKYKKDLRTGKRKLVKEMSDREARVERRLWRKRQAVSRKDRKAREQALNMTPPSSPGHEPQTSVQKKRGRRVKALMKSKAVRDLKRTSIKLEKTRIKMERYRKRFERLKAAGSAKKIDSLRKATKRLMARSKGAIKKTLDFHHILIKNLKEKYGSATTCEKRSIAGILTGGILA